MDYSGALLTAGLPTATSILMTTYFANESIGVKPLLAATAATIFAQPVIMKYLQPRLGTVDPILYSYGVSLGDAAVASAALFAAGSSLKFISGTAFTIFASENFVWQAVLDYQPPSKK